MRNSFRPRMAGLHSLSVVLLFLCTSAVLQNDLRLHFGIGSHERFDKAEIIWPSGMVETLGNLEADRFYVVREGAGVVSTKPSEAGKTTRH
jgi:enediyne biosynthesis protein E4